MIDREYIKLNTSIQTASNAQTLTYDEEGNIEATIELRLPDNIFTAGTTSPKKIDHVEMQTSKMRLSLENTPIAKIPLDPDLTTPQTVTSACQLDVYPFCLLDNDTIKPNPLDPNETNSFPYYKQHFVKYNFNFYTAVNPDTVETIEVINTRANTAGDGFPTTSRFYNIVKNCGALTADSHLLNLCAQSNHEPYQVSGNNLFIKNIGTLEQMLQDGIENAITYASTSDSIVLDIDLIDSAIVDDSITPKPNPNLSIELLEFNKVAYFWKWNKNTTNSTSSCKLNFACKPSVKINEQSITISYDTAAFDDCVPIFWNTPFVNTYDQPEQITIDQLRNSVWHEPPPKRVYKYNVETSSNPASYNFSLPNPLNCAPMNLIANQEMRDNFSFLPWISLDTKKIAAFNRQQFKYLVEYDKEMTGKTYLDHGSLLKPIYDYITADAYDILGEHNTGDPTIPSDIPLMVFDFYAPSSYQKNYEAIAAHTEDIIVVGVSFGQEQRISVGEHLTGFYPNEIPFSTLAGEDFNNILLDKYETNDAELSPGRTVLTSESQINELPPQTFPDPTTVSGVHYRMFWYKNKYVGSRVMNITNTNWNGTRQDMRLLPPWKPEYIYNWPADTPDTPENMDRMQWLWVIDNSGNPSNKYSYYTTVTSNSTGGVAYVENCIWNRIVTITEKVKTITEQTIVENTKSLVLPNISLNEKEQFYILDGTTAEVNIGNQEVIKTNSSEKQFTITTTENVLSIEDGVDSVSIKCGGMDVSGTPLPIVHVAKKKVGQNLPSTLSFVFTEDISDPNNPVIEDDSVVVLFSYDDLTTITTLTERPDITITTEGSYEPSSTPIPDPVVTTIYSDNSSLTPGTETEEEIQYTKSSYNVTSESSTTKKLIYLQLEDTPTSECVWATIEGNPLNLPADSPKWYSEAVVKETPSIPPLFINTYNTGSNLRQTYYVWKYRGTTELFVGQEQPLNEEVYFQEVEEYNVIATQDKTKTTKEIITETTKNTSQYIGNIRLSFIWNNLPIVVLSPISSIVLTLNGMQLTQEIQPINIAQPTGSSLTSTIPVIENFYSLASSLRDLHDELVVVKDSFDDTATYTLPATAGQERVLQLCAKYIMKDGTLHQIYIPKNGVFSIQLTFGISFYFSS